MDRTTVSGVIDRLEKQGLVKRIDDPEDRRGYLILLTEKGKAYEDKVTREAEMVNTFISEKLDAREKKLLIKLLKKMRD